ncbi:hypothetical protein F5876DRAFT_86258 [Lentinula aff. lateritia]|uniref:Uncharacterized protein n=1 Tax=Lentinula aff. lateritia TaxID=2804960 RepID=A0ACC1UCQ7_9AGAR|nr:hypothetical protein F5876DRAFT_86258 [Lentinula aff. lateritia]
MVTRGVYGNRSPPQNPFGKHTKSRLQPDTEFAQDILAHLLTCGKYVKSQDIVDYLARPDVQLKHGLKHTVSVATAKRWMRKLGYRFVKNHVGQYVDGHERDDVVKYRQTVFLPAWYSFENRMRSWDEQDLLEYSLWSGRVIWVRNNESAIPYAKGEGVSLMVADFVSADYGWLRSHDGKDSAQVVFRPGKNRDEYFDNDDILEQAQHAMDILTCDYPDEDHVLVFDNVTTHLKCAPDTPSATKMTKFPSLFGVEVTAKGSDGKTLYSSSGKPQKKKIPMSGGQLPDRTPQSFYFPPGHAQEGIFECKKFKCDPTKQGNCCCRRKLYNEPDFVNGKSLLEIACEARGFQCLFLPKFHCEINPIEQCWGRRKFWYRLLPMSKKEEDLKRNMLNSLNNVTLKEIRRFARHARRFIDAYKKGLDGKMAAWATRKYRGHRVLPEGIMKEYLDKEVSKTF